MTLSFQYVTFFNHIPTGKLTLQNFKRNGTYYFIWITSNFNIGKYSQKRRKIY